MQCQQTLDRHNSLEEKSTFFTHLIMVLGKRNATGNQGLADCLCSGDGQSEVIIDRPSVGKHLMLVETDTNTELRDPAEKIENRSRCQVSKLCFANKK